MYNSRNSVVMKRRPVVVRGTAWEELGGLRNVKKKLGRPGFDGNGLHCDDGLCRDSLLHHMLKISYVCYVSVSGAFRKGQKKKLRSRIRGL